MVEGFKYGPKSSGFEQYLVRESENNNKLKMDAESDIKLPQ
jgi:hypothetical protein